MEDVKATLAVGNETTLKLKTTLGIIFFVEGCGHPEPACGRSRAQGSPHVSLREIHTF